MGNHPVHSLVIAKLMDRMVLDFALLEWLFNHPHPHDLTGLLKAYTW